MSNAYLPTTLDEISAVAHAAADSNYYGVNLPQAIVRILAGQELGIGPIAALRGVHVVKGKTVLDYSVLAALVRRHPRYDYRVTMWTDEAATVEFSMDGKVVGTSTFTLADAKRADLLAKENWKKYPRSMLLARAMSGGVRAHCPDVTMGQAYVPEELEDEPPRRRQAKPEPDQANASDEPMDGDVIDAEFSVPPEPPEPPKEDPEHASRMAEVVRALESKISVVVDEISREGGEGWMNVSHQIEAAIDRAGGDPEKLEQLLAFAREKHGAMIEANAKRREAEEKNTKAQDGPGQPLGEDGGAPTASPQPDGAGSEPAPMAAQRSVPPQQAPRRRVRPSIGEPQPAGGAE